MREPIDNLALSNAVRPGRRRLGEDARARGRPAGDHGQLDRARAGSTPSAIREVYPKGPTEADLATIPLGGSGTPREVGDVVCFLASDRASYVTGTVIPVDGGLTRSLL